MTDTWRTTDSDTVAPGLALLGLADVAATGPLVHALHNRGLASVPTFDARLLVAYLDNPPRQTFAVVLLDSRLPASPPLHRLADLVAAVRVRTTAAILTLGAGSPSETAGGDVHLPLETPVDAIAVGASVLARAPRPSSPGTAHWGPLRLDASTGEAHWGQRLVPLTSQQFHLLEILVAAQGATVTVDRLARALYVRVLPGDLERIRAHMARLRRRLRQASPDAAELVFTVRSRGYRMVLPGRPAQQATAMLTHAHPPAGLRVDRRPEDGAPSNRKPTGGSLNRTT